jgi:serine/threonine-protein kinase
LEDFTREREILTALSHPNIVSVLDLGIHEGLPFAAYDYVRGQTLKEMLTPKIDREVALRFLVGIARGLQYAHDKGVVHRGVKPSNILIDSNQRAHLTDFGLAAPEALHDDFTAMESVSEKIVYLAPEQAAGTMSRVDGRTDVYGLGIVLYEVLTGTVPFHGFPEVVLGQVCRTAPPKLRGIDRTIDKKLEAICLTAIEKEPADRFQSAEEFANRIEEWLAAARLRALRGSWLRRFRSWFGRPDGKRRPENSGPPAGDK